MWILETHIAISVLCWIGIVIMKILYKEEYQRYKGKKKKRQGAKSSYDVLLPGIKCHIYVCVFHNGIFIG